MYLPPTGGIPRYARRRHNPSYEIPPHLRLQHRLSQSSPLNRLRIRLRRRTRLQKLVSHGRKRSSQPKRVPKKTPPPLSLPTHDNNPPYPRRPPRIHNRPPPLQLLSERNPLGLRCSRMGRLRGDRMS